MNLAGTVPAGFITTEHTETPIRATLKPWAFCRRPTRRLYHAVMRELGLYDAYHAALRAYARLLLTISR